jgi:glucose/arabinose dehydrogenase
MINHPAKKSIRALGALACLALGTAVSQAQIPTNVTFTPSFGTDGANQFTKGLGMEEIPGKQGFFLVWEAAGNIWLLSPGTSGYTKTLFVHLDVNQLDADRGIGGIIFHPSFATNHKYYAKFGDPIGDAGSTRVFRVDERTASADFLKDSGSPPRTLLKIDQPADLQDHNGGGIIFGKDGYLYLGVGDGGFDQITPDKYFNGQNREVLLGKILRIDVNRKDTGLEYGIPTDNPFVADANPKVRREIFAYGIRNPFRMTMDRLTGEIYVADVGLDKFEKVYNLRKGANYGWRLQEYTYCFTPGTCDSITVDKPAAYAAFGPVKCFIGGQIYRGNAQSPFYGAYIFGDYTMKRLLAFKKNASAPVAVTDLIATPTEMTGFTLDSQNNIYMVGYTNGTVYKLENADLKPGATTSLVPRRGRLALLSNDGGLTYGMIRLPGSEDVFTLDGKRLETMKRGSSFGLKAGLAIVAQSP